MKVEELTAWLNETWPQHLQESYDNSGEQVIFAREEITGILFCLDLSGTIIDEAQQKKCNLILTHHPWFFKGLKRIDDRDPRAGLLLRLMDGRISCFALHTNFDRFMYRFIEKKLGLEHREVLFEGKVPGIDEAPGFGSLSTLGKKTSLKKFMGQVKEALGLDFLVYAGEERQPVERIAILNGAGGSSVGKIISNCDVDCIITGDVGHHSARDALDYGVAVIDAGHYGTEYLMMSYLRDRVEEHLNEKQKNQGFPLFFTETEKSPFRIYTQ